MLESEIPAILVPVVVVLDKSRLLMVLSVMMEPAIPPVKNTNPCKETGSYRDVRAVGCDILYDIARDGIRAAGNINPSERSTGTT